jgi:hypothetical protein
MKIPLAWLFRKPWVKASLIITAYVTLYATLSLCGQYKDNMASLQKLGIWCKCISDREEWQPAFLTVTQFPRNALGREGRISASLTGYCFLPLVLIDRHYLHPTYRVVRHQSHAP